MNKNVGTGSPKDRLHQEMLKPKHTEIHAVLTGIIVCDEEGGGGEEKEIKKKKEQQLQYTEKTTFLHFQKLKEEIKTTFVVILLTGSRRVLLLLSRVRHNLLLWLADECCRNTLNGLRKRVLKIDL